MNLHKEIAEMSYQLYEKSGFVVGHDLDNWLEAERVVIARDREQENLTGEKAILKKRASATKKSTKEDVTRVKKI